jgi:hypothetical protein
VEFKRIIAEHRRLFAVADPDRLYWAVPFDAPAAGGAPPVGNIVDFYNAARPRPPPALPGVLGAMAMARARPARASRAQRVGRRNPRPPASLQSRASPPPHRSSAHGAARRVQVFIPACKDLVLSAGAGALQSPPPSPARKRRVKNVVISPLRPDRAATLEQPAAPGAPGSPARRLLSFGQHSVLMTPRTARLFAPRPASDDSETGLSPSPSPLKRRRAAAPSSPDPPEVQGGATKGDPPSAFGAH